MKNEKKPVESTPVFDGVVDEQGDPSEAMGYRPRTYAELRRSADRLHRDRPPSDGS